MTNCRNCNSELNGKYCSNCGQEMELKRINKDYIINEVGSVLNFDKGFFYTIRELLWRPGKTIRAFILEDRNRLVKPLFFLIIASLIYSITKQLFHFEDGYVKFQTSEKSASTIMMNWVQNNYGYANILMGVFIAFWTKLFFRKYAFNFYEVLILLCFVMGIGMLIFSFFGIFEAISHLKALQFGAMVGFIYITWAIAQFFDKAKSVNYFKAFLSYFLGMITFFIALFGLGIFIDFIK